MQSIQLLISDIGYIFTIIVFWAAGIFVLVKGPKKSTNQLFFIFQITAANFFTSHVIGINIADPIISGTVFLFNSLNIFIVISGVHWLFSMTGQTWQRRYVLAIIDGAGLGLFIFFMLNPGTFMLASHPVLYFPNYYNPGPLYSAMVGYFLLVFAYLMYELFRAYRRGTQVEKNRLKYVFVGTFFAFFAALVLLLPLYGIYVNPILSAFTWLYVIPFVYSAISYDLMDIRVVARRAAWYAVIVSLLTTVIIAATAFSIYVGETIPAFPILAIPLFASVLVVLIGNFVWRHTRDAEILKDEFVTIVTHKFRTPLTSIKWSAENIMEASDLSDIKKHAEYIDTANTQLVELTNILLQSSTTESSDLQYHPKPLDLAKLLRESVKSAMSAAEKKHIFVHVDIPEHIPPVKADEERIRFIVQVLVDNALAYTAEGKNIWASLSYEGEWVICKVKDEGIGISKADMPHIFTKFYRTQHATSADPEGVGLGLYMARNVIEKQGGKIWAESDGEGKGATMAFKLKAKPYTEAY